MPINQDKKAIVLLSGGLDSTTCLAIAKAAGFACYALSFDYGQRHKDELEAAHRVAQYYQVKEHKIIEFPMDAWQGSALTDMHVDVPKYTDTKEIPVTYVPARNTIFLSIALGLAEVFQVTDIFIGVSSVDYSGYPDCRPEFIEAFEKLANLATAAGHFKIHAPLVHLSKAETIQKGMTLDVDYSMTVSCYQLKNSLACGHCDSCTLRKKGFREAGVVDPTRYAP